MKRLAVFLVVFAFAVMMTSVARARGAPTKQKAFTSKVEVVQAVSPVVACAPVMTGYDVIQNLSESRDLSIAQNTFDVVTTASRRLSPTVAWYSNQGDRIDRARSSPFITLKR